MDDRYGFEVGLYNMKDCRYYRALKNEGNIGMECLYIVVVGFNIKDDR